MWMGKGFEYPIRAKESLHKNRTTVMNKTISPIQKVNKFTHDRRYSFCFAKQFVKIIRFVGNKTISMRFPVLPALPALACVLNPSVVARSSIHISIVT